MAEAAVVDRRAIHEELNRARARFHGLLAEATLTDLRRHSRGTRWTNEELLFHMLFGFLVVRALLVLVRVFGRLPRRASRVFAWLLDAVTVPFDAVNFYGSRIGARVFNHRRMGRRFDAVIAALHRQLDSDTDVDLVRGMHFPARWDPFFADWMTLVEVYRYPTRHFDFHRQQLSLRDPAH